MQGLAPERAPLLAPPVVIAPLPASRRYPLAYRVRDLALGATLVVLATPLLVLVGLAILVTSGWPVFYADPRVGLDGRTFFLWKFRTMRRGAHLVAVSFNDADWPRFKARHDPRVGRLGRFLRRSSLDELPQLVQVLTGALSLVGPRPMPPSEAVCLDSMGRQRLRVRPGVTGLWQVSGRSDLSFARSIALDVDYVVTQSLWRDVSILLRTPGAVLSRRGAY
jgi:lipopolysaccharide/colanic/teichoic acid biosynthesis glycosyltransferase